MAQPRKRSTPKAQEPVRRSTKAEGGGFTFACPRFPLCDFTSTGWESGELAQQRGEQHEAEHNGEAVTPELAVFRSDEQKG